LERDKNLETLPSGTPLDPQADPSGKKGEARMNIDISARKPGEKFLYTGPHLCVTCAGEDRIMNRHFKAGETAPECPNCGPRALWEP
jgi:hypothetical protein